MTLSQIPLNEFVATLASDLPAPGGGSAAALNGALGAALASMVCSLTVGRKKYQDYAETVQQALDKTQDLKDRFLKAIDADTEAFNMVSSALSMPKATDEEKAARSAAMQQALKVCTQSPCGMMELAVEALETVDGLIGKTNATAASDLGCASLNLKSCLQCAWLNVKINIGSIKDTDFTTQYGNHARELLDKGCTLADSIYSRIESTM